MNVISPKSKFVMKFFFKPIMTSALLSDDQELPTLDSFWYMTSQITLSQNRFIQAIYPQKPTDHHKTDGELNKKNAPINDLPVSFKLLGC